MYGIIYCVHNQKNYFQDSHIAILSTISSVCAIKIDKILSEILKKQLSQELEQQLNINNNGQINKLFQVAIDAVFVIDKNGIIINWNNIAEKLFEWNSSDIIGQNISEIIIKSEFKKEFNELFDKVKESENIEISSKYILDLQAINKNKRVFDFSIGISSSYFQGNTIYIVYFRDITERKKAEQSLLLSKEKAEVENKSKSDFLANMSHEIRTPMNAIIGYSDLLSQSIVDEKQLYQVEAIRKAAHNLLGIINDILDLSKIESGKMDLNPERINILNLVKDIELYFKNIISEKGLQYFAKIDNYESKILMIDGLRFRQILINLISNAIKFTNNGYVKLNLEIINDDVSNDRVNVFCMVEDTGIGISKDQQAIIFGEYNQHKGQDFKQYGGTGLGLAISKNLIELMGGKINLTSTVGKGSIFSFYIPNIEIINDAESIVSKNEENFINVVFEKSKVLIVDDMASNRELIKDILSSSEIEIYEADNGNTAKDLTVLHKPDLILMDLKMNVMNGWESAKVIKNNNNTRNIPIIAITASAIEINSNKHNMEDFNDLIIKPISINKFKETLQKYLKIKHNDNFNEDRQINHDEESQIDIEKLEVVMSTLNNKIKPMISNAIESQVVNEYESIGFELLNLGKEYSIDLLVDYGNKISTLTYNFEIGKLNDTLKLFPDFVENVKQRYR